jgi:hypothetical protein|tara:strand:+ start:37 stop:237 length:201 start_codon:yes stop_codon:yes gene_type:complete
MDMQEDEFFINKRQTVSEQVRQIFINAFNDPFGHLLGLSFYIVSLACGMWCVLMALGFAASILGIY